MNEVETLQRRIDLLEEDIERLIDLIAIQSDGNSIKEALAFYADPDSYFAIAMLTDPPCGEFADDISDTRMGEKPGKRARIALGWEDPD